MGRRERKKRSRPPPLKKALIKSSSRVNHAAPAAALALPAPPPAAGWFAVDSHAVRVGSGAADFAAAAAAVKGWAHANALPWVAVTRPDGRAGGSGRATAPAPGDPVVIAARTTGPLALGPWLANPLVVVGVREGAGKSARWRTRGGPAVAAAAALPSPPDAVPVTSRYEVALATTASHVLAGGERFSVTRRAADDSVWFEATAFARPASVAAAAGWPVVRGLQAAFRRGAGEAVRAAAVAGGGEGVRRRGRGWRGLW